MIVKSKRVAVDGLSISYREMGSGPAVLLVHGWPTSSFLYRKVMIPIAKHNRVIAIDLPGFGESDKPLNCSYSFRFYERIFSGFLDTLGVGSVALAVHELGGPLGLYWAVNNRPRIRKLLLLNTLVYPKVSWAVVLFGALLRVPLLRDYFVSPGGLKLAMQIGMTDRSKITSTLLEGVQQPFESRAARKALIKTLLALHPKGFFEIARKLPAFDIPVRAIYGENDRILPDVAKTMRNVRRDLPQTQITSIPNCGHFLQEDRPLEVGALMAEFFGEI